MHKTILTATNKTSQSKGQHAQTQQLHGLCHKYQFTIAISGLEAFKCSGGCGWVTRKAEKSTQLHRPAQVIKLAPVRKTEITLFDLIDKGGAA